MADENEQDNTPKSKYKLVGAKGPGEKVDRIILEGTSSNPDRYIDTGGDAELTEAEAADLRKRFNVDLRKVGDVESSNEDNEGDAPSVEDKKGQENAQRSTTPGGHASNPSGKADKPAGKTN